MGHEVQRAPISRQAVPVPKPLTQASSLDPPAWEHVLRYSSLSDYYRPRGTRQWLYSGTTLLITPKEKIGILPTNIRSKIGVYKKVYKIYKYLIGQTFPSHGIIIYRKGDKIPTFGHDNIEGKPLTKGEM